MAPENDMNEVFTVQFDDSDVITVPIDDTLANSGEAADAAAVGAALALKADKSELPATIKVNGQQADNQGLILVNGTHIPVSGDTQKTLAEAVEEITEMTADTIPMTSEQDAESIGDAIGGIKEDVSDLQEAIDGMETQTAASILMETGSTTTVKNAIETLDRKAVKSVNRKLPDAAGDVDLSVVPLAENLQSDKLQNIEGEFILRTTGGTGSVSDGKAYPQHIFGNSRHDGFVAEVLNMTVIPIARTEPDEPITATIDRDTFVAAVTESGTINLYYTTEWSDDPADYGVTVTGDPVAGDQITIVYVKEVRGTIVVAEPDRLVGTGWNLYDANHEYARVVKYSDVYGYKVGGTYTSLTFSTTLTGERTSILPNANGLFNVTSDGYVFVAGGNATDTYILATWSDWTNGPSTGYWEAYRESGIDLSAVVETYFPYGLLKVGTVRDEIDLVAKKSISRIERMVYSAENRAAAEASGRSYDFDENNIYLVRAESVQSAITIGTDYSVSEHGLEWFTETELPLDTEILYGKNLRDKLERDVVTISAQTLTEEEKAQVRTNIGAMSQAEGDTKLVAPTAAGTTGQLLSRKADGGTEWTTQGTPTDAQVGTAVSAWLTAHPEATTTVEDGAISRAKLNADLQAKTDAVPELKSAFDTKTSVEYGAYNLGTLTTGKYIKNSDGNEASSSAWARTNYIQINNKKLLFTRPKSSSAAVESVAAMAFYSGTTVSSFISPSVPILEGTAGTNEWSVVDVPSNAKYMRLSIYGTKTSEYQMFGIEDVESMSKSVDTLIKKTDHVFVGDYDLPTTIPEDSDFNDYITVGNWRVLTTAIAETIDHMPENVGGRLYIFQPFAVGGFIQVFITALGNTYLRRFSTSGSGAAFEQWRKLINDKDLQSTIDTVLLYTDSDYARLYSRNLMGMEENTYYPVEIKNNERIVFSTYDHSVFPSDSTVLVRMYDKDKTSVGYVYLDSGLYYKVWLNNTGSTVRYLRWILANSINVMVERGNIVHDYVPYYKDLKTKFNPFEKQILKNNVISADPITVTENIDSDGIYSIRMTQSHGRGLTVSALFGETWKPVKLVNVNTGKESFEEYQHGEYLLIGTTGATQIKCVVAKAATNYAELWLVQYGTIPYIYHGTMATSYLPEYSDIVTTNLYRCFGLYDGYAYGIDDNRIKRCDLSTNEVTTFYTAEYNISCGMIMDNGNILYVTAADSENKMYLLKNGTSTAVHDFYDSVNSVRRTPNRLFSLHQYKNIAIVCEYRGEKTPISGYKAFMSDDYGEADTWSTLFDLEDVVTEPWTKSAHLHSCVYDPYGDMYWACSGDMVTVDGIWYSVDKTNWYKIQTPRISMKPTEIIPMRDCVLFVSDSGTVNVYKWQRCIFTPEDTLYLDTITMFVSTWGGACPIGAIGYHDPKMNIAFFGYDTDATINAGYDGDLIKHSDVFVTDGYRTKRIYRDENEVGCIGVYGNDDYIAIAQRTHTVIIHR